MDLSDSNIAEDMASSATAKIIPEVSFNLFPTANTKILQPQQQQQQQQPQQDQQLHLRLQQVEPDEEKEQEGIYENYNVHYDDYNDYYEDQRRQLQQSPRIRYIVEHPNRNMDQVVDDETVLTTDDLIITDLDDPHQQLEQQEFFSNDGTDHPLQYFYEDEIDGVSCSMMLHQHQYSTADILSDDGTYGLPTYLQHQQQQIQRILNVNGASNIYGNPSVYSLHTIMEESENESSFQTVSSVASSSQMHSNEHFEHVSPSSEQQSSTGMAISKPYDCWNVSKNKVAINGNGSYDDCEEDEDDDDDYDDYRCKINQNNLLFNDEHTASASINHKRVNKKKNYVPNHHQTSTMMIDNYGDDGNVATLPNDNIESLLSSKLERYFTSGLLEPAIISNHDNNGQQQQHSTTTRGKSPTTASLLEPNDDDHHHHHLDNNDERIGDDNGNVSEEQRDREILVMVQTEQHQQQRKLWSKNDDHFGQTECLCYFLNQMIFMAPPPPPPPPSSSSSSSSMSVHGSKDHYDHIDNDGDLAQRESVHAIFKHLDRLSIMFRINLRTFLIQVLAQLQQQCLPFTWSKNDDVDDENDACLPSTKLRPPSPIEVIKRLWDLGHTATILEENLIRFICQLCSLTDFDHLLVDHRLWTPILFTTTTSNNNNNNEDLLDSTKLLSNHTQTLMMRCSTQKPAAGPKKATTIIKITADGKLLVEPTIVINNQTAPGTRAVTPSDCDLNSLQQQQQQNQQSQTLKKVPEYRTILTINNETLSDSTESFESPSIDVATRLVKDSDFSEHPNTVASAKTPSNGSCANNRLSKFFRVSNPLNRSFLAKISPSKETRPNGQSISKDENGPPIIDGEISVANWANDVDTMIADRNHDTTSTTITITSSKRRCCSIENLPNINVDRADSQNPPSIDTANRNGTATTVNQNNRMAASNNSGQNGNHHRNSFRSFSNATLDHFYEMFRNPFKSSKKSRKKSIDSTSTSGSSSKSSSEPNLNGSCSKRNSKSTSQILQPKFVKQTNVNNSMASLNDFDDIDYDVDHQENYGPDNGGYLPNGSGSYSKSTPQLHGSAARKPISKNRVSSLLIDHENENRSWTGSWDRRLHHHSQSNLNGTRGMVANNNDEDNGPTDLPRLNNGGYGQQMPPQSHHSNSNRLQRSLSGSNTSSMTFSAFQRPKSCIISSESVDDDPYSSSHTQGNKCLKPSPVPLLGNPSIHYTSAFKNHFDMSDEILPDSRGGNLTSIGKINLSVYYETKLSSLTITIFRCQLSNVKKHKNDLYVKVLILTQNNNHNRKSQSSQTSQQQPTFKTYKKKTKIRKALKIETGDGPIHEAEYNEILRFNGKWRDFDNGQLLVCLWNNDKFGRNTLLGQTGIQLNERDVMLNSIQTRIWHDLWRPTKVKNPLDSSSMPVKGSLFLAIKYDESVEPPNNGYEEAAIITSSGNLGRLHLLIKEADELNINPYNMNGYAYCKIMLKPEKNKDSCQKTRTVKMCQNPRWNETLIFRNVNKNDLNKRQLDIELMWQDKSTKTYLGCVRLTNQEVATIEERNVWKQMIERPNLWAYGRIPLKY